MTDEDRTLYEINLYDTEGNFLRRFPCLPPFEEPPWIMVSGDRYFVLMEDMTYLESERVHFLPAMEETSADPDAERG